MHMSPNIKTYTDMFLKCLIRIETNDVNEFEKYMEDKFIQYDAKRQALTEDYKYQQYLKKTFPIMPKYLFIVSWYYDEQTKLIHMDHLKVIKHWITNEDLLTFMYLKMIFKQITLDKDIFFTEFQILKYLKINDIYIKQIMMMMVNKK